MTRLLGAYFLAGLMAGLLTVSVGARFPVVLAVGTGPIFALAVVICAALSKSHPQIDHRVLRCALFCAACLCSYVISLMGFFIAMGYSPDFLKVARSRDVLDFRADVWVGLVVAMLISSIGTEFGARILTGIWSNQMLARLFLAGISVVGVAYVCTLAGRSYWSFIGVLVPLGAAGFASLICYQLLTVQAHKERDPNFTG
jgi:hypothetical protein